MFIKLSSEKLERISSRLASFISETDRLITKEFFSRRREITRILKSSFGRMKFKSAKYDYSSHSADFIYTSRDREVRISLVDLLRPKKMRLRFWANFPGKSGGYGLKTKYNPSHFGQDLSKLISEVESNLGQYGSLHEPDLQALRRADKLDDDVFADKIMDAIGHLSWSDGVKRSEVDKFGDFSVFVGVGGEYPPSIVPDKHDRYITIVNKPKVKEIVAHIEVEKVLSGLRHVFNFNGISESKESELKLVLPYSSVMTKDSLGHRTLTYDYDLQLTIVISILRT